MWKKIEKTNKFQTIIKIGSWLLFIIVIVGGYLYLRESSINNFNSQLKKLDNQRYEIAKEKNQLAKINNQFSKIYKEEPKNSKQASQMIDKTLIQAKKYTNKDKDILNLINSQSNILKEANSFMLPDKQKDFIKELENNIKREKIIYESSYKTTEGEYYFGKAFLQLVKDMWKFGEVKKPTTASYQETNKYLNKISFLEKYSNKSFSFEKEGKFKEVYSQSYNSLYNGVNLLGNTYNMNLAILNENWNKVENLASKIDKNRVKFTAFMDEEQMDISNSNKDNLESYANVKEGYIKLIDKYEDEKIGEGWIAKESTLNGRNREVANILMLGLELFYKDNNKKYFSKNSINKLNNKLVDNGYIQKISFDDENFKYKFIPKNSYKLTYNEESGEMIEFLLKMD